MANTNKKSMKVMFEEIIEQYGLSEEHKAFIESRIAQIEKKNVSRSSKPNEENEQFKAEIYAKMEIGKPYQAKDIEDLVGLSSPQKASALLGQMVKANRVDRSVVKGVTYFYKVEG